MEATCIRKFWVPYDNKPGHLDIAIGETVNIKESGLVDNQYKIGDACFTRFAVFWYFKVANGDIKMNFNDFVDLISGGCYMFSTACKRIDARTDEDGVEKSFIHISDIRTGAVADVTVNKKTETIFVRIIRDDKSLEESYNSYEDAFDGIRAFVGR